MYGTCKPPPQNYTADQCLRPEIRRATYFDIATSYGFANYFFQTSQGPSLPAHQFLLSGTSAPLPFNDANDPCSAANFQTLSFQQPLAFTLIEVGWPGSRLFFEGSAISSSFRASVYGHRGSVGPSTPSSPKTGITPPSHQRFLVDCTSQSR